jgi:hypothetical protein
MTLEPLLHAALSACGCRPKGTITKLLDGGALSLTGNAYIGEGNHDGAATVTPQVFIRVY